MSDNHRAIKNAFARYATGVTVVSCQPKDGPALAITVNSFTSLSLDPTLVLWCIDRRTSVFEAFMTTDNYAVSVLAADQEEMSNRFATPGQHGFNPGEGEILKSGAPLLGGRLAGFDCEIEARHDAGDHVILIGRVVAFDSRDGAPLLYVGRGYHEGASISDG